MKKVSVFLVGLIILATLLAGCGSKIDNNKAPNKGTPSGTPSEETNSQVSNEENKETEETTDEINTEELIGKEYISNVETKYIVVDPQKEITNKQEDWDVVDSVALGKAEDTYKIIYIKENYPEIEKVKKVSEEFLKAMLDVDYNTFTGREIAPYLTQESLENYTKDNFFDVIKEDVVSNNLIMQMTGIENFRLYFNKNLAKCRVDVWPLVKVISNKDLGEGLNLNEEYWYVTALWLKKENDVWKVDAFSFGGFKDIEQDKNQT